MRYLASLILVAGLLAGLLSVTHCTVIFIPDDFQSIQAGIEESEDGDTLLVDEGSYNESIDFLGRDIVVASHYLLDGDEEHITNTYIDADGLDQRCVTFENGESDAAALIGFTIINGFADYGGGIYCRRASPALTHLRVIENHAQRHGGGMYCTENSNPTVLRCLFSGNTASHPEEENGYGGAVSTRGSSPNFTFCLLVDNEAERYGGAMYCTNGGIPVLDHVTITDNVAAAGRGGVHFYENASPILTNTIHWGNDPGVLNEGLTITFSDIEVDYEGEGIFNQDPLFTDPGNGDYSLTEDSPCVDTGDPESANDPDGTRADVGAVFYHQFPRVEVHPEELDFGQVNIGETRDLSVTIRNNSVIDLLIQALAIIPDDAPFAIVEGEAGDVGQDEEILVTIRFAPEAEGFAEAALRITSNDRDNPRIDLPLLGSGLPPVADINIEPGFLAFGDTPLREVRTEVLTISNTGDLALIISAVELIDDADGQVRTNFQDEIRIEPEQQTELPVILTPVNMGDFAAVLNIVSNDPNEAVVQIRITGTVILPELHFDAVSRTGVNHSLMILGANLDDEELAFGSEIAVFSPAGLCCGADYWLAEPIGLAAWGDNEITEEIDGLRDNEEMSFQVWDIISHEAYPAEAQFARGNEIYHANGVSVLVLAASREPIPERDRFVLHLQHNWNLISAPIILENDDVISLWQDITDQGILDILKDFAGRFYNPAFEFCNIPGWDYHQGYQVKMQEVTDLIFEGEMVADDAPIPMSSGWNIVAYFPSQEIDAITGFENIVEIMTIAKDGDGHFYMPEFGFSNMEPLTRGQGYQVHVRQQTELIWNLGGDRRALSHYKAPGPVHFPSLASTGGNMSLLVSCEEFPLPLNSELGVFTPEGICVGSAALTDEGPWGLPVWADDPTTPKLDGARPNSPLKYKIWTWGLEFDLKPIWQIGSNTFAADQFRVMSISPKGFLPQKFTLSGLYPNPFNNRFALSFILPEAGSVHMTVHNMLGQEVARFSYTGLSAGLHEVNWDGAGLASGVYIFRLESGGVAHTVKAALLR